MAISAVADKFAAKKMKNYAILVRGNLVRRGKLVHWSKNSPTLYPLRMKILAMLVSKI